MDRIRSAKAKLGITAKAHRRKPIKDHSPTDVFRSIVQANRQLNLLLRRASSSADVFRQVTVGVSYASRLLSRFSNAERIPQPPPFLPNADFHDVYIRLLTCFANLRAIGESSGLEVMSFSLGSSDAPAFTASESYDVATMIVSELTYMHAVRKDIKPPQQVYFPGDKLPAHVFQRAGILAFQLEQLQRLVEENPDSFRASENRSVGRTGREVGGN